MALGTAGLEARQILYRPTQMPVTRKEASKSEESTRSISRKSNCSLERRLCAIRASASRDSYSSTERCTGRWRASFLLHYFQKCASLTSRAIIRKSYHPNL